jgi:hypothetical protein
MKKLRSSAIGRRVDMNKVTSRDGALRPRVTFRILLNKWQHQKEKDYQLGLKKKNMSVGAKKKGTKENKLSYIGLVLSSRTIGTKD